MLLKNIRLFLFASLLVVSSCCLTEGSLIETYSLSETDLSKIPYQEDGMIPFKHSEGFEFNVEVRLENRLISTQEGCEDYTENQGLFVFLESDIPRLNIELSLYKFSNEEAAEFSILSDFTYFFKNTGIGDQTLSINGIEFNNVESYLSSNTDYGISEILYSSSEGVLKINYIDSTYVQINP
jgi:hypothetical protein